MSGFVVVDIDGDPLTGCWWDTEEGADEGLAYGIDDLGPTAARVEPVVAPERSRSARAGDVVLCRNLPARVLTVAWSHPGQHRGLPIRDDYYAVLVSTRRGVRYFGSPTMPVESPTGAVMWTAP